MRAKPTEIITTELCKYGCNQTARYINNSGNLMCASSASSCPANKQKNREKVSAVVEERRRQTGSAAPYSYANLPNSTKEKMAHSRGKILVPPEFKINDSHIVNRTSHKRVLISERGHKCEMCLNSHWNNAPISLELDHIDGDNRNNTKTNLRLLCRNCHASTDTWKGRNIVKKRSQYVSDEEFITALQAAKNIRQALLSLGLTAKAANYERAYRLMFEHQIMFNKPSS